jgi:hypothetical protein
MSGRSAGRTARLAGRDLRGDPRADAAARRRVRVSTIPVRRVDLDGASPDAARSFSLAASVSVRCKGGVLLPIV